MTTEDELPKLTDEERAALAARHDKITEKIRSGFERDTKCAFCRKEVDPSAWIISFGNATLLGKEAVDQVCPDCILDAFAELQQWRWHGAELQPHPFDCTGCPDCKGIKT